MNKLICTAFLSLFMFGCNPAEDEAANKTDAEVTLSAEEAAEALEQKEHQQVLQRRRDELVQKGDAGDLNAMITLEADDYYFATPQGLAKLKEWYPSILKQTDADALLQFSKYFFAYRTMLINGEKKYEDILFKVQQFGNQEARLELAKYYDYLFDAAYTSRDFAKEIYRARFEKIRDSILKDGKPEEIERLWEYVISEQNPELKNRALDKVGGLRIYAISRADSELKKETKQLMMNKGYIKSDSDPKNWKMLYDAYQESEYAQAVDKIIASGKFDDMYSAGLSNYMNRHPKLGEKLLRHALQLTQDKDTRANIYLGIAKKREVLARQLYRDIQYWERQANSEKDYEKKLSLQRFIARQRKDQKELCSFDAKIEVYALAAKLGNTEAIEELYHLYNHSIVVRKEDTYKEAFAQLRKDMKQYHSGLRYYIQKDADAQFKDLESLAAFSDFSDDDMLLIISLYLANDPRFAGPEFDAFYKPWQRIVLDSGNYALYLKLKKVLRSIDSEKASALWKKLRSSRASMDNLLLERTYLAKASSSTAVGNYLEVLASMGDTQSIIQLAEKNYLIWRAEPNYTGNLKKAIEEYEALAQAGDNRALLGLGNIYSYKDRFGDGPYDPQKALDYYELALSAGNLDAAQKLVDIYGCSSCEFQDYDEVSRVRSLASAGITVSRAELKQADASVERWRNSDEVVNDSLEAFTKDLNAALATYNKLLEQGQSKAFIKLGDIYNEDAFKGSAFYDKKRALEYYEKAAKKGSVHAIDKLIGIYGCSSCGFYNKAKVNKLLKQLKSHVTDNSYIHNMGLAYYKKGGLDNLKIAAKYFELSDSYNYLARLYYEKDGVGVNHKKSFKYLKLCVNYYPDDSTCSYYLALSYKNGYGVKKNIEEAKWSLLSASYARSDFRAARDLGDMLEAEQQYQDAVQLYDRVARYSDIESIKRLYALQQKGYAEPQVLSDIASSLSAEYKVFGGNKRTATCIGYMYENGIGVEKDAEAAQKWYQVPK